LNDFPGRDILNLLGNYGKGVMQLPVASRGMPYSTLFRGHSFVLYSGRQQLQILTTDLILLAYYEGLFCLLTVAPGVVNQLHNTIRHLHKAHGLNLQENIRIRTLEEKLKGTTSTSQGISEDVWELMQSGKPGLHIIHHYRDIYPNLAQFIAAEKMVTQAYKKRPLGAVGLYEFGVYGPRLETLFAVHQHSWEGEEIRQLGRSLRGRLMKKQA
jgi:hypothetical protein